MKKLIAIFFPALWALGAPAQDNCYFPTQKGAELIYKYYNQRGKALKDQWKDERWMKFVVEDVWPQDNGVIINVGISNEIIERIAKNDRLKTVAESMSYGDVKVEGDRIVLDNMQWVADLIPENLSYIFTGGRIGEGPGYRLDLTALTSFPRRMEVGEALPDEDILDAGYSEILTDEEIAEREEAMKQMEAELRAYSGRGFPRDFGANMAITVKAQARNRKVEAFEKVTTPAGTFDCYKITYEVVKPQDNSPFGRGAAIMMMGGGMYEGPPIVMGTAEPQGVKYADWISPEVGLVKREKYNDRGKVQEVMLLDSYKK